MPSGFLVLRTHKVDIAPRRNYSFQMRYLKQNWRTRQMTNHRRSIPMIPPVSQKDVMCGDVRSVHSNVIVVYFYLHTKGFAFLIYHWLDLRLIAIKSLLVGTTLQGRLFSLLVFDVLHIRLRKALSQPLQPRLPACINAAKSPRLLIWLI